MRTYIEGVGLCGPGLDGWKASIPILTGIESYVPAPTRMPQSTLLPPNERRRSVQTVRLALAAGGEALAAAGSETAETASVFTSSGGDGETIHEILSMLASSNYELSPTRFHNSVHNTPAGYWSIATQSKAPSSSLCCHDDSFVAGLIETVTQVIIGQRPVALVAYDVKYPDPLGRIRQIGAPFAAALVLTPVPTATTLAGLAINLRANTAAASVMPSPMLEDLRQHTPAARSLPLLEALARKTEAEVVLSYLSDLEVVLNVAPVTADSTNNASPTEPSAR